MTLSHRHFEALAASLKELKVDLDTARNDGDYKGIEFAFERHVRRIATLCRVENPEFQFGRFYVAAGIV